MEDNSSLMSMSIMVPYNILLGTYKGAGGESPTISNDQGTLMYSHYHQGEILPLIHASLKVLYKNNLFLNPYNVLRLMGHDLLAGGP